MNRCFCLLLLCGVALSAAPAAAEIACIPVIEPIEETSWSPYGAVSVCIVPGRPDLAEVRAYPGLIVSSELSFHLQNITEVPIAGVAVTVDYYNAGNLVLCDGSLDGLVIGQDDRLVLPLSGGGSYGPADAPGPEFFVPVCPNQMLETTGIIYFNSPDHNGDRIVDLADVGTFAQNYYGAYDYRSDLRWDGEMNLADVGAMATAIGASCQ